VPGLSEWDSGFGELLHHVHYFSTAKIAGKPPTMFALRGGPAITGARFSCSCDSTAVVIEYCRQRSLHFSVYAGIKRPLFEVADNSSRSNMRGIRTGGATKDQRHSAAAVGDFPSPPHCFLKLSLLSRLGKSRHQTAISYLTVDILEIQKKLSGEVLR
jgi:hypothetical protein